ncbi:DUF7350 domain-containing protein [Haloquadratum walsbyi]|uniref:DUF7350 domain-containing protein n=1 Tax=Haloquadratum walsbyi TaxID=293091 RepID=UPI003CCBC0BB
MLRADIIITVESPPQVARHGGDETAFIQMTRFLLKTVRLFEQRLSLNRHSFPLKRLCACSDSYSNDDTHSPNSCFESQTTILLGIDS